MSLMILNKFLILSCNMGPFFSSFWWGVINASWGGRGKQARSLLLHDMALDCDPRQLKTTCPVEIARIPQPERSESIQLQVLVVFRSHWLLLHRREGEPFTHSRCLFIQWDGMAMEIRWIPFPSRLDQREQFLANLLFPSFPGNVFELIYHSALHTCRRKG